MTSYSQALSIPHAFFAQKETNNADDFRSHSTDNAQGGDSSGKGSGRFEYNDLKKIKAGEAQKAFDFIAPQLSFTNPKETQLLINRFYSIHLHQKDGKTPFIFGRLDTYHPKDKQAIKDTKSLQLIFFREYLKPALVEVNYDDLNLKDENSVQSSCLKVEAWLTEEERIFFEANKKEINSIGFDIKPNFDLGLLRSTSSIAKNRFPWIMIISSKWISQHQEITQEGILLLLDALVQRKNRMIINYRFPGEKLSLNEHWNLVPQVDEYSFYETGSLNGIKKILSAGFEKQLMPMSLNELIS
jgi:hypothetical protein